MSFFYPSPAAVARTRRARESLKSNAGPAAGRRAKDTSKPREEKSTPSSSPPASHSNSSELPPDGSPSGPVSSRTATPSTTSVPHSTGGSSGTYPLPVQLETPAALQQYLDQDGGAELQRESGVSSDPAALVRSMPDLQAVRATVEHVPCEDAQSVQSEPTDPPQGKTAHASEPGPVRAESPTSLTSAGSVTGHSEVTHERSNTPPPPPLMTTQSYSPPPYMSPIPVRAHPFTQHFLSYQGGSGYPIGAGGPPYPEANPQLQIHNQYYADYTARFHHPSHGHMQRTHTQDPANPSHRRSNRRPVSHTVAEEDISSLVNRISSVLPDFHTLLDRYDDASTQLSGEPKPRRHSETHLKEAIKEKDGQIGKLQREIDAANETFQAERERFQAEVSKSQTAQRDLEHSLLARTKSRDHLREISDQLQKSYEDLSARSNQIEFALESFRTLTIQNIEAKERSLKLEVNHASNDGTHENGPNPLASPEPSSGVPGYFAESRGPSPLPIDTRPPEAHETMEALGNAQKEIRDAHLKEMQVREKWNAEIQAWQQRDSQLRDVFQREREAQANEWEAERGELKRQWHEHQQMVQTQHEHEKADLHRVLDAAQTRHTMRCRELEADNQDLREQVEQLKAQLASERSRRSHSTAELKAAVIRVEHESRHLRHLVETDEAAGSLHRPGEGDGPVARISLPGYHIGHLE